MLQTPLGRSLGIEHPIFCAGMGGGTAGPELVAAVSEAGGCGVLGLGGTPLEFARELIRETHQRTRRPFGANLLLPLLVPGSIEACLEEGVSFLVLFFGDPAPHVAAARRAGVPVFAQVGSPEEARAAADAGVDGIFAQGFEAGGHVRGTTSLAALLPAVVDAVAPLPVVASGGIADGRGIVSALALGAQGVSLGTRFLASDEARATQAYKERVVRATATDTIHTFLFDVGWPDAGHRVLRNRAVEEWEAAGRPAPGRRPGEGTIIGKLAVGPALLEVPRYAVFPPSAGFEGDMELAALYAGESCSLVNDVRPAGRIVQDLVREAEEALAALRR